MEQKNIDYNRKMALHFHQLSLNYKKEAESFDGINLASQRAAHKCKQLVKRFNHEAVMCIMRKHSAKHQQSKDILDLHQLQVNEATQCLDLFLDHGIKQLRKTSDGTKKDLYVITGQGRHSLDGVPKIKLRTVEHLRERRLSSSELNPGYLMVEIREESSLSSELI